MNIVPPIIAITFITRAVPLPANCQLTPSHDTDHDKFTISA
jgi:hypothetical protein